MASDGYDVDALLAAERAGFETRFAEEKVDGWGEDDNGVGWKDTTVDAAIALAREIMARCHDELGIDLPAPDLCAGYRGEIAIDWDFGKSGTGGNFKGMMAIDVDEDGHAVYVADPDMDVNHWKDATAEYKMEWNEQRVREVIAPDAAGRSITVAKGIATPAIVAGRMVNFARENRELVTGPPGWNR